MFCLNFNIFLVKPQHVSSEATTFLSELVIFEILLNMYTKIIKVLKKLMPLFKSLLTNRYNI